MIRPAMLALLASLIGCPGSVDTPGAAVAPVARYELHAELGVIDYGGSLFVFDDKTATIVRGDEIAGRVVQEAFASPTVIPAPDGNGRWLVAVVNGQLQRLTIDGQLEPAGVPLGLADDTVLAIAGNGDAFVAGLAHGAVASADGIHVKRFEGGRTAQVAAARARVALVREKSIDVLDLVNNTSKQFTVQADRIAFLDADGTAPRLVVSQRSRVLVETNGRLEPLATPFVRELAVSGTRLWLVAGGGIYVYENNALRRTALAISERGRIFGSPSGDLWIDDERLVRYSTDSARDSAWHTQIEPIFVRTCAKCHRPGETEDSGVDLSRPQSWRALRVELYDRLLVEKSMPPADSNLTLTPADSRVLERWLR